MSKRKEGAYMAPAMITATKIWPFLGWKDCGKCRSQFRRQPGWLVKTEDRQLSGAVTMCGECFPTANSAIEHMRGIVAAADSRIRFEAQLGGMRTA
jgi:bacterioferritin-associated ferredoxin